MRDRLPGEIVRQPLQQVVELAQSGGFGGGRQVLEHEVHGLGHGLHSRGLLVRHADAIGVLELLHQGVEVERVRVEVALEVRLLGHARRVDLELVGQMGADQLEDFVSGHGWSGKVAAAADGSGALRRAPASASRSCVRPSTSSRTPRAATSIAAANPRAPKEPWGTTPRWRRPSSTAPPCASGSIWSRSPRSAGLSSRPPSLERSEDIAASRTERSSTSEVPSITFSATLPA